ncbi:hemagglutinin repeat-containing protein, partial [Pseudothauera rhizosphaerae]|uniref:hemagglutinin repeat-containing protein n=1 Tax=Pseudothauera rhizosphaerae TaxID=2565932 RepID=UPI001454DD9D
MGCGFRGRRRELHPPVRRVPRPPLPQRHRFVALTLRGRSPPTAYPSPRLPPLGRPCCERSHGFSIQLNAGQAKGRANGTETVWDNTLITATDTLTVTSGRDTTLKGAQLAGDTVLMNIGGDLLIETLQDVSRYTSKQSSSGLDLSLCIPPICYGSFVQSAAYT